MRSTVIFGVLALLLPALGELPRPSPATTPAERAALQKTVVVSVQRIVNESSEGRAAGQRMQALYQKMTADLTAKQKELSQPNGSEFQRLAQQSQAEFANAQKQAQAELRAKMTPAVADIAAQRGADIVLNEDTLVWAAPKLDITHEVIAKMDAAASGK